MAEPPVPTAVTAPALSPTRPWLSTPCAPSGLTRRSALLGGLGALGAARTAAAAERLGYERSPWPARQSTPALDLPDTEGRRHTLADFQGRAAILNFWASWCEPCRAEMPTLHMLLDIVGPERLAVLAINFKETRSRVEQYRQSTSLRLPVLLDGDGVAAAQWGAKVFPTTVLIDCKGRPRWRVRGQVDWSAPEAQRWVDALLA